MPAKIKYWRQNLQYLKKSPVLNCLQYLKKTRICYIINSMRPSGLRMRNRGTDSGEVGGGWPFVFPLFLQGPWIEVCKSAPDRQ